MRIRAERAGVKVLLACLLIFMLVSCGQGGGHQGVDTGLSLSFSLSLSLSNSFPLSLFDFEF